MTVDFAVEGIEVVVLDIAGADGLLAGHDLMSPYVWRGEDGIRLLVRVLPNPLGPQDPTGVIYAGRSADGLAFAMQEQPAIVPGPADFDAGGVEDPTVVVSEAGELLVFYTGVDARREQGSLLVARGSDMDDLTKQQVLLKAPEGEGNIKEATVARGADGRYRLFYEYARDNASRIGLALSDSPEGPWEVVDDPFTIRADGWDNWHLSTGPISAPPGECPVMFYNGATDDARWRIGWIAFDENYTRVVDRCIEPLIVPPPPRLRSGTDIAFAASCLDGGGGGRKDCLELYFSLEDRVLRRARVKRFSA
ncbi:glycosidase [Novosphingobium flavum]|uniref:Glycosidase n=1 Tax=Novosphingobium flavum TaxID=1778672 RepID=A0A7X1FT33_9SPHN|nr:glycosidase [Novosphingobium flavum]MBC2665972.1 glycosidase [Novosphingobium flavum]